jgi:L-alanine-DL-glutamate epimerase-like enolase superfamily enzyme
MTAPRFVVPEVERYEWPFTLRIPFRFGVVTVTEGRQAVVRVRIRLEDGRAGWGMAAETLIAKWFDKDPRWSDEQNRDQLRAALESATRLYQEAPPRTAFGHFAGSYAPQLALGAAQGLNPLVASYGPALLDRAVLDALCRVEGVSFYEAVRRDLVGFAPDAVAPDLAGFDAAGLLAVLRPADSLSLRHTVGLVDPITAADVPAEARVADGLPQTLEEVVERYRPSHFKLKVAGDAAADIARLSAIAAVLDRRPEPYFATLDGNEQYADAEGALALWAEIERTAALARLRRSILFIEQPIKRAVALEESIAALAARRPVIIDESDGTLDAFPRARALGYDGVSSKTCKGLYKSLINLARCRRWNEAAGTARHFMSGEDLTTLAGLSVQQDLALASLLGITHVERNGHHYIDGFAGRPSAEAQAFLAAHPDLYREEHGAVRLRVEGGRLALRSLAGPGYAAAAVPDVRAMERMPQSGWRWPAYTASR